MDAKIFKLLFSPPPEEPTRVVQCMEHRVDIAFMSNKPTDVLLANAAVDRHTTTVFLRQRRSCDIVTLNIETGIRTDGVTDQGGWDN